MMREVPDASGYSRVEKAAVAGSFAMNCARMFNVHGKVFWNDDLVDAVTLVAMSSAGSVNGSGNAEEVIATLCGQGDTISGVIVSAMVDAGQPENELILREMVEAAEKGSHCPISDQASEWIGTLRSDPALTIATGIAVDAARIVEDSTYVAMTSAGRSFDGIFPQFRADAEASPTPSF